jgi:hypothetical protein
VQGTLKIVAKLLRVRDGFSFHIRSDFSLFILKMSVEVLDKCSILGLS